MDFVAGCHGGPILGPPVGRYSVSGHVLPADRAAGLDDGGLDVRGPRTAAGKSRSSRNAVKHGMYSRSRLAITEGPFAEDEDEVEAFLDEII